MLCHRKQVASYRTANSNLSEKESKRFLALTTSCRRPPTKTQRTQTQPPTHITHPPDRMSTDQSVRPPARSARQIEMTPMPPAHTPARLTTRARPPAGAADPPVRPPARFPEARPPPIRPPVRPPDCRRRSAPDRPSPPARIPAAAARQAAHRYAHARCDSGRFCRFINRLTGYLKPEIVTQDL